MALHLLWWRNDLLETSRQFWQRDQKLFTLYQIVTPKKINRIYTISYPISYFKTKPSMTTQRLHLLHQTQRHWLLWTDISRELQGSTITESRKASLATISRSLNSIVAQETQLWYGHSILSAVKQLELKKFLYETQPDIVLLQETWFNGTHSPYFQQEPP